MVKFYVFVEKRSNNSYTWIVIALTINNSSGFIDWEKLLRDIFLSIIQYRAQIDALPRGGGEGYITISVPPSQAPWCKSRGSNSNNFLDDTLFTVTIFSSLLPLKKSKKLGSQVCDELWSRPVNTNTKTNRLLKLMHDWKLYILNLLETQLIILLVASSRVNLRLVKCDGIYPPPQATVFFFRWASCIKDK